MNRREHGAALLLVLWVTVLLAALLAGVAAASRSHAEAALYGAEEARAGLAAEAGLAHAVAGLRAPGLRQQWVPDGRPYTFAFDGAKVTVRVVDVTGLVDLNAAAPALLAGVFQAAGAGALQATRLADAIVTRRDGGAGGRRDPLRTLDDLAHLPGMTPALFARVVPAFTVASGRNYPDSAYAGPLVLAALDGVGTQQARALVAARRARAAVPRRAGGRGLGAGVGAPLVAGYGGITERVFSLAEMPDGARAGLDVTLRLALTGGRARPYKVLDWRTGLAVAP